MSSRISVVVKNVFKEYSSSGDRFNLKQFFTQRDKVHSLSGVSLLATEGDSIGVLGRNGSGKSTLLRLIAGVESPTSGEILAKAEPTLLGVSAALQPYLTGRQNVRLGLLAQGCTPEEAENLEPSVAAFADIGDAIDRPMSTYSSGMGARLKFAISTAVTSDILLVDEALSTGDAAFSSRAEARMRGFLEESGCVFIVSHGTATIDNLCNRALWIDNGHIVADGEAKDITEEYRKWAYFLAKEQQNQAEAFLKEVKRDYVPPNIYII